jgi:hypothetical protein
MKGADAMAPTTKMRWTWQGKGNSRGLGRTPGIGKRREPMALGVLNNLPAIYAEELLAKFPSPGEHVSSRGILML